LCMEPQVYDFTADDLIDQGEIGHGNYGTVNKMYHECSGTVMAVKVITLCVVVSDIAIFVLKRDVKLQLTN